MSAIATRPGLSFDEDTHTYRVAGEHVPGVTSLLDKLHDFAGVPVDVLERAKHRGSFVHRMVELYDLGTLDEDDPALVPYLGYLTAWKNFLRTYEPNWIGIEERDYSERFRFAGTLDRRGELGRIYPGRKGLFDVKTGDEAHWCWGVQTAAYRQIVLERHPLWALAARYTIQLRSNGRFDVLAWNHPDDWHTFSCLLHLHYRAKAMTK